MRSRVTVVWIVNQPVEEDFFVGSKNWKYLSFRVDTPSLTSIKFIHNLYFLLIRCTVSCNMTKKIKKFHKRKYIIQFEGKMCQHIARFSSTNPIKIAYSRQEHALVCVTNYKYCLDSSRPCLEVHDSFSELH